MTAIADTQPAPGRSQRWRERADRWRVPEVTAGAVIAGGWAAAAALAVLGSPPAALALAGLVLWLHLAAIETGNHTLAWMATGVVVLCLITALSQTGLGPIAYAGAATTALGHSDLIRLNHTRRRGAQVDRAIPTLVALGLAASGLVAVAGIALARFLAATPDRNWLWMPATVAVMVVVAVALTVFPVRRAPAASRERWRPGDRLPPPPPPDTTPAPTTPPGPAVGTGDGGR